MHDYLQIVTEICHFAQMLLLDSRMKLAREPLVKISGTCSFDHAHFMLGSKFLIWAVRVVETFLTQQINRDQHIYI
jgi:hypothetical protein